MEREENGMFVSLGGGGHNSSKQFRDDADKLAEANYELQVRRGELGPTHTTTDFSTLLENNTTVNV